MAPIPKLFSDTGPYTLPDVGLLFYNGCTFSSLFSSTVSSKVVMDDANRTTKWIEFTILVEGYVTLNDGITNIAPTVQNLYEKLTASGGVLSYQGRGCDIQVNTVIGGRGGGAFVKDVAWGPIPEMIDFQPMGGGLSAKVKWQVKTRFSELAAKSTINGPLGNSLPLLQFNYETSVSYGEDCYCTLSVKGTVEIPLVRTPDVLSGPASRTITQTADTLRSMIDSRIMPGIDLTRFRVTKRDFPLSRDKRTLIFNIQAEEKPYMDLPVGCTIARGSYNVRPARQGMGIMRWNCTLRATYTVRPDRSRRTAWLAFLALLRLRMSASVFSSLTTVKRPAPPRRPILPPVFGAVQGLPGFQKKQLQLENGEVIKSHRSFLIDFHMDEGLYLDSKTTSFSATWTLVTAFSNLIMASGMWTKVEGSNRELWSTSMIVNPLRAGPSALYTIQGSQAWSPDRVDPALDVIVDFGGP